MILISITYATTTPESIEAGDFEETGCDYKREEVTFRELVQLIETHRQPSSIPVDIHHTWFSSGFETTDYSTGEERETSIHFHRDNPERNRKYWRKAAIAAGIRGVR